MQKAAEETLEWHIARRITGLAMLDLPQTLDGLVDAQQQLSQTFFLGFERTPGWVA